MRPIPSTRIERYREDLATLRAGQKPMPDDEPITESEALKLWRFEMRRRADRREELEKQAAAFSEPPARADVLLERIALAAEEIADELAISNDRKSNDEVDEERRSILEALADGAESCFYHCDGCNAEGDGAAVGAAHCYPEGWFSLWLNREEKIACSTGCVRKVLNDE